VFGIMAQASLLMYIGSSSTRNWFQASCLHGIAVGRLGLKCRGCYKHWGFASDWMTGDRQGSHGQIVGVAIVSARGGNLQTPLELVSAEHRFLQKILEGAEQ
jgi:hypothetical protein